MNISWGEKKIDLQSLASLYSIEYKTFYVKYLKNKDLGILLQTLKKNI